MGKTVISSAPITRRQSLAWLARAGVVGATLTGFTAGCGSKETASKTTAILPVDAEGYGRDPDLLNVAPAPWPLTMDETQRQITTRLADIILPADDRTPAASEIGVPAFIDEWISAPYPIQATDRVTILEGVQRLKAQYFLNTNDGGAENFVRSMSQQSQNRHPDDYKFFSRFRYVAMTGFYASEVGIKDLGYVGNVPMQTFDGPPLNVLKKLGLDT